MVTALKTNRKLLAWMPALLILSACAFVAAGINIIKPAHAATSVNVTGTVTGSLNIANTCGSALTMPALTSGGAGAVTPTCSITFNTSGVNGAQITAVDSTPGDPLYGLTTCHPTCTSSNTTANVVANAEAALLTGEAGINLDAIAGTAVADMTAAPGATVAAGKWYDVTGVARNVCHTTAPSGAGPACNVRFGAIPKGLQAGGSYNGQADFTATDL